MEQILPNPIDVGKGIYDYGALAMMGAFLLVFVGAILFFFFKMLSKLFNGFLQTIQDGLQKIMGILTGNDLGKIRVVIKYALKFIPHEVCVCIADVKDKNHLSEKEDVEQNLRTVLENLYKTFIADIDIFAYEERKLSYYCKPEWIELIYDFCMKSIYDGKPYHRKNYLVKLNNLYEKIKVEFFENLNKK